MLGMEQAMRAHNLEFAEGMVHHKMGNDMFLDDKVPDKVADKWESTVSAPGPFLSIQPNLLLLLSS